jgi:hypothetical protein
LQPLTPILNLPLHTNSGRKQTQPLFNNSSSNHCLVFAFLSKIIAMKKIFTFSALAVIVTLVFTSCVKQVPFDEGYWLSKERGRVVYSSSACPYYVLETVNGYTVVRSISSRPYEGDILYGDFSYYGVKDIYNRSYGTIISGDVKEYWLTYLGAQDAIDYYCY